MLGLVVGVFAIAGVFGIVDRVAGAILGNMIDVAVILAAVCVADFVGVLAMAQNGFLASHARAILIVQMALLVIPMTLWAVEAGFRNRPWSFVNWMFTQTILFGIVFGIWAYVQAHLLASDLGAQDTQPALNVQLGYTPGSFNDTRVSSANILHIIFGGQAWALVLVAFVTTAVVKSLTEMSASRQPGYKKWARGPMG